MTNPRYVEILGSDGNIYIIESGRVGYDSIELSIIPHKIKISREHYYQGNTDLHKDIVEQYIANLKRAYAPEKRKIAMVQHMLNSKQVNNHFDYLHLLQQINPMLNELFIK